MKNPRLCPPIAAVQLLRRGHLLIVAITLWADTAAAESVLLVKSQSSPPISQALEGFRSACNQPAREIDLKGKADAKEVLSAMNSAKPVIIVAFGPQAAEAARGNVGDLSLLFVMVANPGKRGLEGKNIGGIALNIPVFVQFTNYTNVVRNLKKLGVIYDETKTGDIIKEAKNEADKAGIELAAVSVSSQKAVVEALKNLIAQKVDALWMLPDETVVTPTTFPFLQKETAKNRLPLLAVSEIFVQQGALASLSVDYKDMGRQAGEIANAVIKSRQTELRTFSPAKINLAVNAGVAGQLGGAVNENALKSASKTYR